MRALACVGLSVLLLIGNGCSLLNKKKAAPAAGARGPTDSSWPLATGNANPAPPTDRPVSSGGLSGLLAGQVVDIAHRKPPATFIQVVSAQEAGTPKGAPIEVAADQNGYFVIQGLQPGQPYELIARAKDGDRMLAGRLWVRPPDPKVLIRISEDFATPTTPPVPPPPGVPGQRPASPGGAAPGGNSQSSLPREQDWAPGRGLTTDGRRGTGAELGTPQRAEHTEPAPAAPQPASGSWPPNVTSIPPQVARNTAPPATTITTAEPAPPLDSTPNVPTPIPSCMLIGNRLHNLALRDLSGQAWEFRHRQGRLVLLDFWYSDCVPCLQAIHHLKILQKDYDHGLEVIGIAYESGPPAEHAEKVRRVSARNHINYRLLLGSGRDARCPVREQFQVFRYPTLFLIDANGQVLKKYEGLSDENRRDLETLLQYHLGAASR